MKEYILNTLSLFYSKLKLIFISKEDLNIEGRKIATFTEIESSNSIDYIATQYTRYDNNKNVEYKYAVNLNPELMVSGTDYIMENNLKKKKLYLKFSHMCIYGKEHNVFERYIKSVFGYNSFRLFAEEVFDGDTELYIDTYYGKSSSNPDGHNNEFVGEDQDCTVHCKFHPLFLRKHDNYNDLLGYIIRYDIKTQKISIIYYILNEITGVNERLAIIKNSDL